MLSSVRPSVRPSHGCISKTVEVRIMQFSSYIPLSSFCGINLPEILTHSFERGVKQGWVSQAIFLALWYEIRPKLLL